MTKYMTVEQILDSARNDISKHIAKGTFKANEGCDDDEENFYTIESLYCQWAEDEEEARESLWAMFEAEHPQHF